MSRMDTSTTRISKGMSPIAPSRVNDVSNAARFRELAQKAQFMNDGLGLRTLGGALNRDVPDAVVGEVLHHGADPGRRIRTPVGGRNSVTPGSC